MTSITTTPRYSYYNSLFKLLLPEMNKKLQLTKLRYFTITIPSASSDFRELGNISLEQLPNWTNNKHFTKFLNFFKMVKASFCLPSKTKNFHLHKLVDKRVSVKVQHNKEIRSAEWVLKSLLRTRYIMGQFILKIKCFSTWKSRQYKKQFKTVLTKRMINYNLIFWPEF